MEPVTQALLGAASAELVAGRQLGRKALLWGALLGMSPDLDVIAAPLHDGFGEWLYHRGTTHSLWFGFVAGPLAGWGLWRWRDPERRTPLASWIALAIAALVTHPLLDGFTPYGTQLFAPFWRERFAWNGVGIVDPFYSLPLAIGLGFAAFARAPAAGRAAGRAWGLRAFQASLVLTTLYLFAGVALNQRAEREVRRALESEGVRVESVRAYPTVMQPWTRHFVARSDGKVLLGWHSALSGLCPSWRERAMPPPSANAQALLETWEGGLLTWFAQGQVGIDEEATREGVVVRLDDLRYAWGSASARGMWGVEARFDRAGRMLGPVRRFDRSQPDGRDVEPLLAALRGRLPRAKSGWRRPADCEGTGPQLARIDPARAPVP